MTTTQIKKGFALSLSNQIWWQLTALVVLSTLAVMGGKSFQDQWDKMTPEAKPLTSVFNKKPSGLSGLSELAGSLGMPARAWVFPYRYLSQKTTRGMLVIVAPSQSLGDFEAEQILDWVHAGNDLVFIDHFGFASSRRLLKKIGIGISEEKNSLEDAAVTVDAGRPEFAHVQNLQISATTKVRGGTPVVQTAGSTIFSVVDHGDGRILIGTAPSLCSNYRFADRASWGNFQFLINWLSTAHGEIMFDERCHGFSQSGNVFITLAHGPVGSVTAQLLLILAVAVFSAANRFGALRAADNQRKVSNLEFIAGLSNAYRRAQAKSAILEIMSQSMRGKMGKVLAISPHEPYAALIEAFERRPDHGSVPVRVYFTDMETANKELQVSDEFFKTSVANYDKINQFIKSASENRDQEPR